MQIKMIKTYCHTQKDINQHYPERVANAYLSGQYAALGTYPIYALAECSFHAQFHSSSNIT
jgi:hypothetical protein